MERMIIVYVTYPGMKSAEMVAKALLKKRLAACITFFPVKSVYIWKGKAESGREVASFIKTGASLARRVEDEVKRLHPYEVPCIARMPVRANLSYEQWVQDAVRKE